MLQKIPIKSLSNKIFQPWKSEMTDSKNTKPLLVGNLALWIWRCETESVWSSQAMAHVPGAGLGLTPSLSPNPTAGVGMALRNPGGSFPVLCFPKEQWLLFSCLCYFLDKTFRLLFRSLKDAGAQWRFPLVRSNLSQLPFPKPCLIPGTGCSQDKLSPNSKHYARMFYCLIALSFTSVNCLPNAYGCWDPSTVIMTNRRIKAVNWGEIPSHKENRFLLNCGMQRAVLTSLR